MNKSGNWKQVERLPHNPEVQPCVEHMFGNVLHREFPLHVAKVREYKRRGWFR